MNTYENLFLCQPTPEQSARTCGPYWYLITDRGTAHTAFRSRESLITWMHERGLKLSHPLVDQGKHDCQKLIGGYQDIAHMSYDEFYNLDNVLYDSKILSNGNYTLARIAETNGIRQIHSLNPNCHYRPIFNYSECRASIG